MADTITLKSSSEYSGRYMQLVCTQTSNGGAKNTSTIKWTLSTVGGNSLYYTTGPTKVVINGVTVYSKDRVAWTSESFPASKGSKSGELTVSHATDGTKSIKVSLSTAIYESAVSTDSKTWKLDSIPRYGTATQSLNSKTETTIKMKWASDSTVDYIWYSKDNGSNWTGVNVTDGKSGTYTISGLSAGTNYGIKTKIRRKDSQLTTISDVSWVTTYDYPYCTSAPDFTLGDAVTLKFYNPLSRAFKFYIIGNGKQIEAEYNCSSTTYKGVNGASTSVPQLYATIPNAKSGKYKVKVTYGSSVAEIQGGTYKIKESSCYPTFTAFNYRDTNDTITKIVGSDQILVKGLSTVTLEISKDNKMTAKNSANPKNYVATIGTVNKTANYSATDTVSFPMGKISTAGTKRITITAYDSRNLPKAVHKDVTVYDYAKPVISASVKRLNNFEAQSTLKVSGSYSRLTVNSADKNALSKVEYRYRVSGGEWGNWTTLTTTVSNGKFTCNDVIFSLDNSMPFEFEVKATDKLGYSTKKANVGIGQAIFMVSSNKRTAYLNGEEVATNDNVRQTKYYTQLAEGTDLNKIVSIGTYRSIQSAHTESMKNTPTEVAGGFALYVQSWTSTSTNTAYRRQEIIWGRFSYVRRTNDGGATWSEWQKTAYIEELHPVGSVYCNSTNTNPSTNLGGTWSLIGKGFKETFSTDKSIFTPYKNPEDNTSNVTLVSSYIVRNDSSIRIRLDISTTDTMTDTTKPLGTLNFNKIGITGLDTGYIGQATFSDGANGGIMWNLIYDTGELSQVDVISTGGLKSDSTFYIDLNILTRSAKMIDSFCDKFYWKRTE